MPRNPSELQRLEEERLYHLFHVKNLTLNKSSKEAHLRELRAIDKQLGTVSIGNYNGG